jgi:coenzyme PQQ synthesis protein D (PqqD)
MDVDLVPRRRKNVHGVEIDSESVLYDARNGSLHLLNWSASAVWWSIDGTSSVDELAVDLAERFGASREVMQSDLLKLLDVLAEEQLVDAVRSRSPRQRHA